MKKNLKYIFIIIGLALIFIGLYIFVYYKKGDEKIYIETDKLDEEKLKIIVGEKIDELLKLYENPGEFFTIKEEVEDTIDTTTDATDESVNTNLPNIPDYYELSDYENDVKKIFTESGISQLEKVKIDGKLFITISDEEGNKKYSISKNINYPFKLSDYNKKIDDISVNGEKITATVSFENSELGEDDILDYYVYNKDLILIKNGDNWLIDYFEYSVE